VKKIERLFSIVALRLALVRPALAAEQPAHPIADSIKSAVIYEVNPRTFSAAGDFRGIEQRLDYLKDLGVTIIWIMPTHPVGQAKKKGGIGSAYAVRNYYAINPSYGTNDDLKHLVTETHTPRVEDHHRYRGEPHRLGQRASASVAPWLPPPWFSPWMACPCCTTGWKSAIPTESGAPALLEKLPVFWEIAERRSNFLPFYKQLIAIGRAHPAPNRAKPSG
jgi:hypothetical protein